MLISTKTSVKSRFKILAIVATALLATSPAYAGFICDFEGYEPSEKFFEMMQKARKSYDVRIGLGHYGTREIHEQLQSQTRSLQLDSRRTPIVTADLDQGKIDVFYCSSEKCSKHEIESEALLACMSKLGAKSCRTYAIKVDDSLVCTTMPGYKNGK